MIPVAAGVIAAVLWHGFIQDLRLSQAIFVTVLAIASLALTVFAVKEQW